MFDVLPSDVLVADRESALAPSPGATLGPRVLNRALLERQLLLRRQPWRVADALEHLVGMQAQSPNAPYYGLWSRLSDFEPDDLAGLVDRRLVVRIALMRWTLHVVTAHDCLALRPLLQPVMDRRLRGLLGRHLCGVDLDELVVLGRELVDLEPRTLGDIGTRLAERWPGHEPSVLGNALAALAPLVHVPPRGLWGRNGRATQTTAERWLGRRLHAAGRTDELLLRYLAAFGPARIDDMRTWSGLRGLNDAVDRLRPRLRHFRDEHGHELLDVPDGPLPDPDTPAPPRFLPGGDNAVLSHADRSRIVCDAHRRCVTAHKTFLVDGFVRGTWKVLNGPKVTTLAISPLAPIGRADRLALAEEGMRLLAFDAGEDTDTRVSVRFDDR
ncbi:MAG TPA: winged helix DNA-binding domain-containing protein [Solirubrobacteraceae bacterium]|jgi:hypothetical protein|nr:winged helix DNA-binding domain-containing protein [Solirubrobacteraceae bacterium]